jgi:hypothetical protein
MNFYFGWELIMGFNVGIEIVDPSKLQNPSTGWILLVDLGIVRLMLEKEGE